MKVLLLLRSDAVVLVCRIADVCKPALQTIFADGYNSSDTTSFADRSVRRETRPSRASEYQFYAELNNTFTMRVCTREAAAGEVREPLCWSRSFHELGDLPPVGRDLLD
jgi:hypothetical protein